jgi:hypothetical protein
MKQKLLPTAQARCSRPVRTYRVTGTILIESTTTFAEQLVEALDSRSLRSVGTTPGVHLGGLDQRTFACHVVRVPLLSRNNAEFASNNLGTPDVLT